LLVVQGDPLRDGIDQLRGNGQVPVGVDRADVTEMGGQYGDAGVDVPALPVRVDERIYREAVAVMWNST